MREEFGHLTSSVLSELVCISYPFTRNDLDTFYPCPVQKLHHGHIQQWSSLLNTQVVPCMWLLLFICLTCVKFFRIFGPAMFKAPHLSGEWAAYWAVHKWHFCHPSASSAREGILQILWQHLCCSKAMSYPWHILKEKLLKSFTTSFPPRIWTKHSSVFWAKCIHFFSYSVDHRNSYRCEE